MSSDVILKPTLIATKAFEPRYAGDRGETVTHLQFLHHFGEPHCKICNYKVEKVARACVYIKVS